MGDSERINAIKLQNCSTEGIGDFLKTFVKSFDDLDFGERKLLMDSLIDRVIINKNKKVTVTLQPPLHSLGFLSPSLALRV